MSSVASQVILHPVASQTLKMWSATAGRDKTYRAVQYFSRFLAWYLVTRGNKLQSSRFNALKNHLGTARKLMRLGKPLEHLQAALRATLAPGHAAEQIATIGRQISYFGYLSFDAVTWANAIKFISLRQETAQKLSKHSNRFWFAGVLFSIAHGSLKLGRLANEARKLSLSKSKPWSGSDIGEEAERDVKHCAIQAARAATLEQFTIDILDIWIPATNLGYVNFNDGVLGIIGFITSVMALCKQWEAASGKR